MKVTAVLLSFVMVFTFVAGAFPISVSAGSSLIGDVDKDGSITVSDALRILRACAGLSEYDEEEKEIYDVWSDGKVEINDALGVLRSSIGAIGSFGRTGVEFIFEPNKRAAEAGVTQAMVDRAMLSIEGTSRVAKVMDKAARGEAINLVTIGGSITAGSSATTVENRYANIIFSWWRENFPQAKVSLKNSGIGATGSLFGVHRLERDVLKYKPDLLIVEFAVNDDGDEKSGNPETYENLIRRVLNESPETAIIMLFMTAKNYVDKQSVQKPIGEAYSIPMISYRDVILPEFASGRFTWEGIAPDGIHPNDQGHAIVGGLVNSYLDGVKKVYKDSSRIIPSVPQEMLYTDKYMNANLNWAGGDLEIKSLGSWTLDSRYTYYDYVGSWYLKSGRRAMEFEVECKNLMVLYEMNISESEIGSIKISVDGGQEVELDSYFENGWGNYLTIAPVYSSDAVQNHTVKITPIGGKFRIAAILTA